MLAYSDEDDKQGDCRVTPVRTLGPSAGRVACGIA